MKVGFHINAYGIIERAVEEGAAYGWNRAHKHTDKPTQEQAVEEITRAVMNEICEWIELSEEDDDEPT